MQRPTMSIRTMLVIVAFIALACVALVRANSVWASVMFSSALATLLFAVLAVIFRRGTKQAFWIGFALFGWGYLWMAHWPGDSPEGFTGMGFPIVGRMQQDSDDTLATTKLLVFAYQNWLPLVRTPPPGPPAGYGGGGYGGYGGGSFSFANPPGAAAGNSISNISAGTTTADGSEGSGGNASLDGGGAPPIATEGGSAAGSAGAGPAPAPPPTIVIVMDYPAQHDFTRVGHSLFTIIVAFVGGVVAAFLYSTRERAQSGKSEPAASAAGR
jgi:hypothetical protein